MDSPNQNPLPEPAATPTPENKPRRAHTGGLFLIILGILFLLRELFPWWRFDHLWPLILIGVGLWLVYRKDGRTP